MLKMLTCLTSFLAKYKSLSSLYCDLTNKLKNVIAFLLLSQQSETFLIATRKEVKKFKRKKKEKNEKKYQVACQLRAWVRSRLGEWPFFVILQVSTGWPKSKFLISNGSTAEINHIWAYVGKVKIGLRGSSFFLTSAHFFIHFK